MPSRRKPIRTGGPGPAEIDEDALIKRYTLAGISITGCGRQFRVSTDRVKRILAAHGVEVRSPAKLDEGVVVTAYQRHQSVNYVAKALGIDEYRVKAILSAHDVKTARPPRPMLGGEHAGPAPGDRMTAAQAARLLGRSWGFIDRAAAGEISEERDEHGRRRFIRSDIQALGQRHAKARHGLG